MISTTIFTKTAKGVAELKDGAKGMSESMARALRRIDGKTTVGRLFEGLHSSEARTFSESLKELEARRLIRVFLQQDEASAAALSSASDDDASLQSYQVVELDPQEGVRAWAEARRGAQELTRNGFYTTGQAGAPSAAPTAPASREVLVVEDDEAIAKLIQLYLTRHGFIVRVIGDGLEAIKSLEADALPGLLLLDVNLPNVNGFDILAFTRSSDRSRGLPAIMVTAQASEADVLRGLREGADGYIFKPFEWKALHSCINRVLGIA
ncbi:response regulator [Noviherbaspirillum galbum]|uniref:Response regulator n=1 Tax=Noviherbaspirillum galbum TaxID=2709383 RepID=A0A6B3SKX0_9BURK|nr:response regulator [Noviherbaspirillum galbum]NEX60005.1 response regulator [Noviherbaspirillum galbum]